MLFSSITFLYYFLPIVLPRRGKNLVLLLASLVFYWWGEPRYVFLMLFTIAFAYVCGLLIGRFRGRGAAKGFLVLSVAGELAVLGYFKYADFFLATVNTALKTELPLLSIALPIGISFYTFQTLSYTVDVYRGTVAPQRSFLRLATYIAMFPQLIALPRCGENADGASHHGRGSGTGADALCAGPFQKSAAGQPAGGFCRCPAEQRGADGSAGMAVCHRIYAADLF